ncbi:MAG TPA: glutamyl-tRNA reductase [Flavobacteriaceae bacterium]|nr:glutamyl-tRNA reductase [Flavobacteriaceae bacterium]
MHPTTSKSKSFYTVGLSYKKADEHVRGLFSLDGDAKDRLLVRAREEGLDTLMVISTCNRTELYGFAEHPFVLIKLLTDFTRGSIDDFQKVGYVHKNDAAVSYFFEVATGLDSQILGDFEVIGQLKQSFIRSKSLGMSTPFLERLVNSAIQASKRVKNETELSSGAASVSFAAVQYIMTHVESISEKKILLFGTGKIGRNTCENLVKHTKNDHIVLINRTKDKAEKIAGKFNLIVKDYADLQAEIRNADVMIVATGAQNPTVSKELIYSDKNLLVLDLSVPKNVANDVSELPNVQVVHLDHLSQITDETLERRKAHIPQALQIIEEIKKEFYLWQETRKFAPTISALKKKLKNIKEAELDYQRKKLEDFDEYQAEIIAGRLIQKITTHFVNHLKNANGSTSEAIELIEKVFRLETQDQE